MRMLLSPLIICCALTFANPYKILGVFPAPAFSHFTLGFRLMKEAADRGHEVVFINSHPQKEHNTIKNLRDVSVEDVKNVIGHQNLVSLDFLNYYEKSYLEQLQANLKYGSILTETVLNAKSIQDLVKSNEKFDLVIMENFLNEAMVYFAHRFNCPLIMLSGGPTTIFNNYIFGNPSPPSYVRDIRSTDDGEKMNFWQRLSNAFKRLTGELFIQFVQIPEQNRILQEAFPGAPDLNTILYNASLLFTSSHISTSTSVPFQQNIKEIGSYFVAPPKPLPQELKEYMDNAKDGVVVFSMGSNVQSKDFDARKKQIILKVFSKIKQRVLWKFEEDIPDKPKNVKILSWLPQADVIAHPNTVAFISHGGLLGTTEAVYHGVPILGLPVFGDQSRNIRDLVQKGMALKIHFNELEEKPFEKALFALLNNPNYRKSAKKVSSIMRDNPSKPLDEALFWIEYVIRHEGALHLRSAALDLPWYQLYHLDIILFVFAVTVTFITTLYLIFSHLLSCLWRRKKIVGKNKKNK